MTLHIIRILGGVHHQVVHRMTGKKPQSYADWSWRYPLLDVAMLGGGLGEVETYIACFHNTATQYIVTRPIIYMFL